VLAVLELVGLGTLQAHKTDDDQMVARLIEEERLPHPREKN